MISVPPFAKRCSLREAERRYGPGDGEDKVVVVVAEGLVEVEGDLEGLLGVVVGPEEGNNEEANKEMVVWLGSFNRALFS